MAGSRETDTLKPVDQAILGMVSESSGRNESEREVASKESCSGGRAFHNEAKAERNAADWLSRRTAPAG